MMDFNWNIGDFVKRIPLHSLMGSIVSSWATAGGLNWITALGNSWNTGGNKHHAWLKCLARPIQSLHGIFLILIENTRYRMNITGQVIYLEHYLNDLFDDDLRRIYISDGSPILSPFIFKKEESQPEQFVYTKFENQTPFYLNSQSELASQNDFVINVPNAIPITNDLENQIKAAVNQYKQAGSRYTIESF